MPQLRSRWKKMAMSELNAAILLQVRMGSSRLAGKAMMSLCGMRMLFHVVSRLKVAEISGPLVIATSDQPTDDFICSFSSSEGVACFRGSEDDVLSRFREASKELDVKYIIRATGDNPLVWEGCIEHLGRVIEEQKCDYITYNHFMPVGLSLEIFTKEALEIAFNEAKEPNHREHVTSYIYTNKDRFDCVWITPPRELEGDFRLTVDTTDDYELMKQIYDRLYTPGEIIPAAEAVKLLKEEPALAALNSHVKQKSYKE